MLRKKWAAAAASAVSLTTLVVPSPASPKAASMWPGLSQIPGTRDILAATASTYYTAMTILKYTPLRARLQ
jgi:hypothetical protein